jgi:hypothetical protein
MLEFLVGSPSDQSGVPGVEISFGDRVRRSVSSRFGVELDSSPRVDEHAVSVVDGLGVIGPVRRVRTAEQDSHRPSERFAIVLDIAERCPHTFSGA